MNDVEGHLASVLSHSWWLLLLRGLVAIAFGILAWVQPGISLAALVLLFGIYAIADGFFGTWTAIAGRKQDEGWWVLLLGGLLGIGVGVLTFLAPGVTALALLFYIAIWAIATGVLEVIGAIRLRKEIKGELWLVVAGLVSIVLGVLLMARPAAGALAMVWLIASYAIVFGVMWLGLAFRVRSFTRKFAPTSTHAHGAA